MSSFNSKNTRDWSITRDTGDTSNSFFGKCLGWTQVLLDNYTIPFVLKNSVVHDLHLLQNKVLQLIFFSDISWSTLLNNGAKRNVFVLLNLPPRQTSKQADLLNGLSNLNNSDPSKS